MIDKHVVFLGIGSNLGDKQANISTAVSLIGKRVGEVVKCSSPFFSKPWGFTKLLFWAGVIMMLVFNTPNKYRTVSVTNKPGNWVLCESSSDGARAVNSNLVHAR